MIYGIPLFGNRVAPRCTIADSILLIKLTMNRIVYRKILKIDEKSWNGLLKFLDDNNVDTLVCGGINYDDRQLTEEMGISIIDNVACSETEVVEAIKTKTLKAGLGLSLKIENGFKLSENKYMNNSTGLLERIDCLACEDYKCLEGKSCNLSLKLNPKPESKETANMLNSAMDISLEEERVLCRISELIYFAIDMNYKKIGIAYCSDLAEPAGIVAQVMRRFFNVVPICCKIGGKRLPDVSLAGNDKIACNASWDELTMLLDQCPERAASAALAVLTPLIAERDIASPLPAVARRWMHSEVQLRRQGWRDAYAQLADLERRLSRVRAASL